MLYILSLVSVCSSNFIILYALLHLFPISSRSLHSLGLNSPWSKANIPTLDDERSASYASMHVCMDDSRHQKYIQVEKENILRVTRKDTLIHHCLMTDDCWWMTQIKTKQPLLPLLRFMYCGEDKTGGG